MVENKGSNPSPSNVPGQNGQIGQNLDPGKGTNVSGRSWKVAKDQLRPASRAIKNKKLTSWELKLQKRLEDQQFKQKLKELKDEKEEKRQNRIQALRLRRENKEEKERYERLAAKMHAKKVDRLRRREKRNKALKER
ncbi:LAMI_0D06810g1_1 [Lachancea mirantina]|uniref:rRNA-processing protein n=1 Tax=Lachancea mirantina TaxID=1230905 RepID=A0A1G4JCJ9_9SACH|nr:LAMI_0D06810g1_1 [Lachancea mirantina]